MSIKNSGECSCGKKLHKSNSSGRCRMCQPNKCMIKPSKEDLSTLKDKESIAAIGRRFGVSGSAVRKWMYAYGILETPEYIKHYRRRHKLIREDTDSQRECIVCSKDLKRDQFEVCSSKCFSDKQYHIYIRKWLSGEVSGGTNSEYNSVSKHIRRYLIQNSNGSCEICKLDSWLGKPMPLVLDHVNGDWNDHSPVNLRIICGNCDMQTPFYKSRNLGSGRYARTARRKAGKSY